MHLREGIQTHSTVLQRYRHLTQTGAVSDDAAQRDVAAALDRVIDEICNKRIARKSSSLGWLFAKRTALAPVKGLYIHGGVGRGKTMLMDMFFELVPVRRKRRVHFNAFMSDVHDRIQKQRQARKDGTTKEDDPIPPVAKLMADEAWVVCFDEFSVTDIADAMILSRLFSALFSHGVVLVATSNVAPDDLYRDGLNRQLFLPFITLLSRQTEVLTINAGRDYRLDKFNHVPVYLTPLGTETDLQMNAAWDAIAKGVPAAATEITLKGRKIQVPMAAGKAARFSFAALCEQPHGARDFLAIADRFATLMIDAVPVLDETRRSATKRFILLIDTVYDRSMRLIMSADVVPELLYEGRNGTTEAFEFDRTVSRLKEMQSKDWLDAWDTHHKKIDQPQV
ncbi:cell division protein ZapE [Mesorhizobium sp. NBSH29]|uniref:cell division protein ZapE n=1 Tax=Mesorhizobium sp. NBSH29 TaxID=2654249 RepID=UPI001896605C|nr:cell division protein ZapE [Mesorhizobium sp. NBSH29]QPC86026.1 cell division protein ZapE [Mesorhizobium sp. NBSH29]